MKLSDISIHAWLQEYQIKTESGIPLDFKDHMYMFDVYSDLTPIQAIMKGAQITASTAFSLKVPWVVKNIGLDAIYTLPTETDRNAFVGGKVNRMIAQNPIMQEWVKDKDSVEQKQIGNNLIHFRGTFTQKAAIMVPSDLNVYDEIDASKQSVIEQYATRLQHSKYQWEWYLSHPSAEGTGVHKMYVLSDQKHWFIKCSHCNKQQYLSWPESICLERKIFQCKDCKKEIYDDDRRRGEWVKKYRDRPISGFYLTLEYQQRRLLVTSIPNQKSISIIKYLDFRM
jgi:phage terminase large subunit GpA-like protein